MHCLEHGQSRAFDQRYHVLREQFFGFIGPRTVERVLSAGADFIEDPDYVLGQRYLLQQTFHTDSPLSFRFSNFGACA